MTTGTQGELESPPTLTGPNRFLVDLVAAAEARGWFVAGWRNGKVVEIELHRQHSDTQIILRSFFGLGLDELIAEIPRGDEVPT
ncbi:MAG TPA: hypothetical protein VEW95_05435 [Candidatus Limnocylindrales bacterium]|nr:hypothetical protein [Candidatus Limnocylindrales bacterium]